MSRIDTRLVRGLTEVERGEFEGIWAASRVVREAVASALTDLINSAILNTEKVDILSSPNALAQIAHFNGRREVLREVIKLITPLETP